GVQPASIQEVRSRHIGVAAPPAAATVAPDRVNRGTIDNHDQNNVLRSRRDRNEPDGRTVNRPPANNTPTAQTPDTSPTPTRHSDPANVRGEPGARSGHERNGASG